MLEPPIAVTLPNDRGWRPKLGAPAVSALLQRMAAQDVVAVSRTVFKALGLPGRPELAKRLASEAPKEDAQALKLKHYRWINRALSMELLASLLLSHLNRAERVRSFCMADGDRPHYFAGSGRPDLLADYPASGDASAFRVLGEVSALREMAPERHLEQLEQALRHAKSELEKKPDSPVIAWVVNNGDVGSDPVLRRQYQKFVRDNGLLEEGCGITVAPMHTADAAHALALLCSEPPAGGLRFPSGGLAVALCEMADRLAGDDPPGAEGWMAQLFVQSVGGQASLLPPDPPSDDDDGPPGTR